jgi:hypothetical protein
MRKKGSKKYEHGYVRVEIVSRRHADERIRKPSKETCIDC